MAGSAPLGCRSDRPMWGADPIGPCGERGGRWAAVYHLFLSYFAGPAMYCFFAHIFIFFSTTVLAFSHEICFCLSLVNNNNNRRLVTLAEHTSDHGRQTNSNTEE